MHIDQPALSNVVARAEAAESAQLALQRAIRDAYEHGHSLRAIANAAGISHEQVRRVRMHDDTFPVALASDATKRPRRRPVAE
jgi:methyl coenzyme M reductase gamma subunit